MAVQRTFSIIKPDAVAKNVIGEITTRFEKAGLRVVASKLKQLPDFDDNSGRVGEKVLEAVQKLWADEID